MEVSLKEQEMLEYIEQEAVNKKKKALKCKSLNIQRIVDSHLEYIKDKTTYFPFICYNCGRVGHKRSDFCVKKLYKPVT